MNVDLEDWQLRSGFTGCGDPKCLRAPWPTTQRPDELIVGPDRVPL